jgi:hypothetical protein
LIAAHRAFTWGFPHRPTTESRVELQPRLAEGFSK